MARTEGQTDNHKMGEGLIPQNCWGKEVGIDADRIRANFFDIKRNIAPCKPRIIGVTKYYGRDSIIKGFEAGIRDFGESRAIEAVEKIESLPEYVRQNSEFHFIGHLQTNKVDRVVGCFKYIHSVDSIKLAKAISDKSEKMDIETKILLQVNNAGEEQKFGYSKDALRSELSEILNLSGIKVVGLMNMAPLEAEESVLCELFADMLNFKTELESDFKISLPELSMGMSNDYKIAVKAGATMIRIGRKLFS